MVVIAVPNIFGKLQSVQLSEFQRCKAGGRLENGDEVAGILKSYAMGNILNFGFRMTEKPLFCF